jgi:alpha-1,3/alpha-1,6-mannosyltransferase
VRIAFLHPDLGLGGAERLVVDAALELQAGGHRVTLFTAAHDPARAFPETADGTLDVRVRGALLPPHLGQRLRAPCAIVRMAYLAGALRAEHWDVVVCDLVAHAIPVIRAVTSAPVVFYCHFPDRLLAPRRTGLYRWYRAPIDRLEERATGLADRVLVNSRYTAARFREAFPRLGACAPEVVHPGVVVADAPGADAGAAAAAGDALPFILCLGRFDPAKDIVLAVEAFAALRTRLGTEAADLELVLAGGYDPRLVEQRATIDGLAALARRLGVDAHVRIVRSPTEPERKRLLSRCLCVVYTPKDEHFGLVPLEAMAAGRPVIAVSRGGPAETVVDGETGLLCEPRADAFADALLRLVRAPELRRTLGAAGRAHVARSFSRARFGARFEAVLREVAATARRGV